MNKGLHILSEREKETLRLLLGGYDAKSIAHSLNLSVHTVNERLREARRKMGVTSSREAARLLSQAEQADPNFLADKQFGDAGTAYEADKGYQQSGISRIAIQSFSWILGGLVIMSLIFAALLFSPVAEYVGSKSSTRPNPVATAPKLDVAQARIVDGARRWLAIADNYQWGETWSSAGAYFKTQVTAEQWAAKADPVRRPLGKVVSRTVKGVQSTGLPPAPVGEYAIIQFRTRFDKKVDTIETVTVAREKSEWSVVGYFIAPDINP